MKLTVLIAILLCAGTASAQTAPSPTFAERLGWPKGAKVVIFHIDDAGMSYSSNEGTIKAMTEGLATSCSIMMPCPWVSGFRAWLKEHPDADAGLHFTLTSEWEHYRWGPVAGKAQVPGLADKDGCLWDSVALTIKNASADEVEKEIRAQLDRAITMGIQPTHLDSHMGTLFESTEYLGRYVKVGIEKQIPVLFPGGHMHYISQGAPMPVDAAAAIGQTLWDGGLPVVDDIYADTYDWPRAEKTDRLIAVLKGMAPGILEVIVHCTDPTEEFAAISPSGDKRKGDLEAMLDPRLKKFLEDEGIIRTTWREMKTRRDALKK